jgi:hypothetical protein
MDGETLFVVYRLGTENKPSGWEGKKVPATKNREVGILPRFGGWHLIHGTLFTGGTLFRQGRVLE